MTEAPMADNSTSRSARAVYGISVAAELSGVAPQTLRLYERHGLVNPSRTDGGTRRYSDNDLDRLARITELVEQGVNLVGIARVLELETRNRELQSDYTALEVHNAGLRADRDAALKPTPVRGRNAGAGDRDEPRRATPDSRPNRDRPL
jgi:DNA-binding transcriptional MerR regulator